MEVNRGKIRLIKTNINPSRLGNMGLINEDKRFYELACLYQEGEIGRNHFLAWLHLDRFQIRECSIEQFNTIKSFIQKFIKFEDDQISFQNEMGMYEEEVDNC